jgi:hypothetical protein
MDASWMQSACNPVAVLPGVPGHVAGLTNKVSQAGIHYLSTERKYDLIILKTVKYQQVLKKESGVFFFQLHFPTTGSQPVTPKLYPLSTVAFHTPFPS